MAGILGKKVGMTSIFDGEGNSVPVTIIEAGPCVVLQKRTSEKEGYSALRVGFAEIGSAQTALPTREHRLGRPELGLFKKANLAPKRYVRELRLSPEEA